MSDKEPMATDKDELVYKIKLSTLQILIVDDSEFDRTLLHSVLTKLGARNVQIAESGTYAIGKIENARAIGNPFELVFLDWKMPQLNGQSLLRILRRDSQLRNLGVIITTGQTEKENVQNFIDLGIEGFVVKPVTLDVIGNKIKSFLRLDEKNVA